VGERMITNELSDNAFERQDDVDESVLLGVLGEAVQAIEDAGIPYVFIGGLASVLLGPPSSTNDIDFFVRPEDAETVLKVLEERGFATKVHDPTWLMKGVKNGVLVDVIFKSTGDIFLDDEMLARATVGEFKRQRLRIVSAEDLMVMKALAWAGHALLVRRPGSAGALGDGLGVRDPQSPARPPAHPGTHAVRPGRGPGRPELGHPEAVRHDLRRVR
jgi:predicted nucleotidyltransferase